ncbi:helix-turn-helix domain-containing protein (plasmid) [Pseudomonas fulva]|jgi:hypothetical protein|uniref:Helix-turn-helix domain-containing protein n=3 Tax=Pseudomonas TaxID=286 RepID=A0AAJ5S6W5_9PSED|nr:MULTISPECIES: helix-turn-helix domain-containing protein [Pseudomonas]MDH1933024.1 helix-turn-helix domain-containing protein [Pseudomonas sp. GD03696]MDM1714456.1 helix-turn-helix domain-containing protein [Pseudomonas sp. 165]QOD01125.1 helix-turn-helix domain-containing protein [Pseudomonas putida]QPH46977.1 helix-turn-helix domain-containing protein [Pseudomonas fulva]QPH52153.1 helix-turn-helix domain-containing protein [Pseudomonas fulva]
MMQHLDPTIADQAKAADNAALGVFHTKVLELCDKFSIKEAARLLRVSTGYLRTYSNQRNITYADRDNRTPAQKREIKKLWDHYLIHYELRQVESPKAPVQPGDLEITPGMELKGRKALVKGQNAFLARCNELAELFTVAEAADILGVSHRFLKNYAYNEQITFVGGPSLDVKNEFYDRAAVLAGQNAQIQDAAKELNVTTRYLTGYAKHWQLNFVLTDAAAAIAAEGDSDGDHSYMADMCLDDAASEVAVTAVAVTTTAAPSAPTAAIQSEIRSEGLEAQFGFGLPSTPTPLPDADQLAHIEFTPTLPAAAFDEGILSLPTPPLPRPSSTRLRLSRSRTPVRSRSRSLETITLERFGNAGHLFLPTGIYPQPIPRYGTPSALL